MTASPRYPHPMLRGCRSTPRPRPCRRTSIR
jgi:hypothetical protein